MNLNWLTAAGSLFASHSLSYAAAVKVVGAALILVAVFTASVVLLEPVVVVVLFTARKETIDLVGKQLGSHRN